MGRRIVAMMGGIQRRGLLVGCLRMRLRLGRYVVGFLVGRDGVRCMEVYRTEGMDDSVNAVSDEGFI